MNNSNDVLFITPQCLSEQDEQMGMGNNCIIKMRKFQYQVESSELIDNISGISPIIRLNKSPKEQIPIFNLPEENEKGDLPLQQSRPIQINKNNDEYLSGFYLKNFDQYSHFIIQIQSVWRGILNRKQLFHIRTSIYAIQRVYRYHLHLKYELPYNYFQIDQFLFKENEILIENYQKNLSFLFPALFQENCSSSNMFSFSKTFERDKIHFFSKILDFDLMIDSDECYDTTWAELYDTLYIHCCKMNVPIQIIELGGQHTLALDSQGMLYSFGWNNYSQCGESIDESIISQTHYRKMSKKYKENKNNLKLSPLNNIDYINSIETDNMAPIKNISCGEDHSLILDCNGIVWGFGLNLTGQLSTINKKIVQTPTIIHELEKESIKLVKCEGNLSFALNKNGDAFMWPWSHKTSGLNAIPTKLQLKNPNERIKMIACGNNFIILLSSTGQIYSMGKDNKYGQLGHGDYKARFHPSLIHYFKENNETVTQISCGFKHCAIKTLSGKAYAWGLGVKGQLGSGSYENISFPSEIKFEKKGIKVYQISAGFRCTYFLLDDLQVYMCGCNGTSPLKAQPTYFDPGEKIPEMKIDNQYIICRIMTTWNKSFSIFYATIVDCSKVNAKQDKLKSMLNKIAMCWTDNDIDAPYIYSIADYFGKNGMKRPKKSKDNIK